MISPIKMQSPCLNFKGGSVRTNNTLYNNYSFRRNESERNAGGDSESFINKIYGQISSYAQQVHRNRVEKKARIKEISECFPYELENARQILDYSLDDYKEFYKKYDASKILVNAKNPFYLKNECPEYVKDLLGKNTYVFYGKAFRDFKFSDYTKEINVPTAFATSVLKLRKGKIKLGNYFDFQNCLVYNNLTMSGKYKKAFCAHIFENDSCDFNFPRFVKHFNKPMTFNRLEISDDDNTVIADSMIVYDIDDENVLSARVYVNPQITQDKFDELNPYLLPNCKISADSVFEFERVYPNDFQLVSYMNDVVETFKKDKHCYVASDVLSDFDDDNSRCKHFFDVVYRDSDYDEYYKYSSKARIKI